MHDYRIQQDTNTDYRLNILPGQNARRGQIQTIFDNAKNELSHIKISDEAKNTIEEKLKTNYAKFEQTLAHQMSEGAFETNLSLYTEDMRNILNEAESWTDQTARRDSIKKVFRNTINNLFGIDLDDATKDGIFALMKTEFDRLIASLSNPASDRAFGVQFKQYCDSMQNLFQRAMTRRMQDEKKLQYRINLVKTKINLIKMQAPTTACSRSDKN